MTLLTIEEPHTPKTGKAHIGDAPLFRLGFRPFYLGGALFLAGYFMSFDLQDADGLPHEVKGAKRMMEARVVSTRIYIITQAQLLYAAQALEVGMLYDIKDNVMRNGDKAMHRVIKGLALIVCHAAKVMNRCQSKSEACHLNRI